MIRTLQSKRVSLSARRGAALVIAVCAAVLSTSVASAQNAATVSVNPNSGPPGSQFTITLNNFHACAADKPNCITIEFVQNGKPTPLGTADSKGSPSFTGTLTVPPTATAGSALVHARSDTDDAQTGFTVTNAPPATTTTAAVTTTVASTTTTVAPTTTITTVVPPLTEPSTTTTIATKKSSSHSDVPRYIAVILVVLAAAATAAVDTRMRRLNPPPGGP